MPKKPLPEELYAWEINWETAAAAVLKNAGLKVVSLFLPPDKDGNPDFTDIPDDHCMVRYEPSPTDETKKAFMTDVAGAPLGLDAVECGWQGDLVITHRVPVDDLPPEPGGVPKCYPKLMYQAGLIRSVILHPANPFGATLAIYDILSIRYAQPDRAIDPPRAANQATERFRCSFQPARGAF